jgi:hypothetical protein
LTQTEELKTKIAFYSLATKLDPVFNNCYVIIKTSIETFLYNEIKKCTRIVFNTIILQTYKKFITIIRTYNTILAGVCLRISFIPCGTLFTIYMKICPSISSIFF